MNNILNQVMRAASFRTIGARGFALVLALSLSPIALSLTSAQQSEIKPTAESAVNDFTAIVDVIDFAAEVDRVHITRTADQTNGFGISTYKFHLSDDPTVVGTLQGDTLHLELNEPRDLYLVGPSTQGVPSDGDLEHNGTVTGYHFTATWTGGTDIVYDLVEAVRHHPASGDYETRSYNSVVAAQTLALDPTFTDFSLLFDGIAFTELENESVEIQDYDRFTITQQTDSLPSFQVFNWTANTLNVTDAQWKITAHPDSSTALDHIQIENNSDTTVYVMGVGYSLGALNDFMLGTQLEVTNTNGELSYTIIGSGQFISTTTAIADLPDHAWSDMASTGSPTSLSQDQFDYIFGINQVDPTCVEIFRVIAALDNTSGQPAGNGLMRIQTPLVTNNPLFNYDATTGIITGESPYNQSLELIADLRTSGTGNSSAERPYFFRNVGNGDAVGVVSGTAGVFGQGTVQRPATVLIPPNTKFEYDIRSASSNNNQRVIGSALFTSSITARVCGDVESLIEASLIRDEDLSTYVFDGVFYDVAEPWTDGETIPTGGTYTAINTGVDLSTVDKLVFSFRNNNLQTVSGEIHLADFPFDSNTGALVNWWASTGLRIRINSANIGAGIIDIVSLSATLQLDRIEFRSKTKGVSRRIGELVKMNSSLFIDDADALTKGYLAIKGGATLADGATMLPTFAAAYPHFVVGNDIVFPAWVDDVYTANTGTGVEGTFEPDATAANGLSVISRFNRGENTTATGGAFRLTGSGSEITINGVVSGDPETQPNTYVIQHYFIVDSYYDNTTVISAEIIGLDVENGLEQNDQLLYNASTGKWIAAPVDTLISTPLSTFFDDWATNGTVSGIEVEPYLSASGQGATLLDIGAFNSFIRSPEFSHTGGNVEMNTIIEKTTSGAPTLIDLRNSGGSILSRLTINTDDCTMAASGLTIYSIKDDSQGNCIIQSEIKNVAAGNLTYTILPDFQAGELPTNFLAFDIFPEDNFVSEIRHQIDSYEKNGSGSNATFANVSEGEREIPSVLVGGFSGGWSYVLHNDVITDDGEFCGYFDWIGDPSATHTSAIRVGGEVWDAVFDNATNQVYPSTGDAANVFVLKNDTSQLVNSTVIKWNQTALPREVQIYPDYGLSGQGASNNSAQGTFELVGYRFASCPVDRFQTTAATFTYNSATFVEVPDISFTVEAGNTYKYEYQVIVEGATAASDLKLRLDAPDGVATTGIVNMGHVENAQSKSPTYNQSSGNMAITTGSNTVGINGDEITIKGWLTPTISGSVQLFIGNNAGTNATQVRLGSNVFIKQVN